jgi:hypothetical protein
VDVLEDCVADRREQPTHHYPGQELSIRISRRLYRLARPFLAGPDPRVYVVAVWIKPGTRSRGESGEPIETPSILQLPVFLDAAFGLAHGWVLCIGLCSVVLPLFVGGVLGEGMSFSLIGIERDAPPTRLSMCVSS